MGYADAGEIQRKSQLAAEIARAINARRLTQEGAAELLGIEQSKVSRITRGQFRGVSETKLLELPSWATTCTLVVPERIRKGMGQYPIPVVLLARLAVDQRHQGQGIGPGLLRDAIARALTISEQAGVRAMMSPRCGR